VRHSLRGASRVIAAAGLLGVGACVSLDNPSPSPTCGVVGTLTIGVTLQDSLTSRSCRLTDNTYANAYQFRVDSQAKLVLSLSSPGGATLTWLTDSTGVMIANSYVTQQPDTTTTVRLILRAGSYEVVANSSGTTPTGPLRLTVARDSTAVAGNQSVTWLSSSVATTQTITTADHTDGPLGTKYYYHLYLRWVQAGAQLQLTEHSTAFTPGVQVSSLSGGTVAQSALDSTLTNASVSYGSASEDILLLWIGAADSLQVGAYTLTVN